VQVYRELDAATAKPTAEHRRRVRHHLVDCVDPRTDHSLAAFVAAAELAVRDITRRGAPVILAGGTGLYLRGLLRGIVPAPARDERLRERLRRIHDRRGAAALHRLLERLDPASAARIAPADAQRVVRAIEFAFLAGETWSARLEGAGTWASGTDRHACMKIGLALERSELHARLERRVDEFFARGLIAEVEGLLARGVPRRANALKAIGYREVLAALDAGRDPWRVVEEVKRSTRRYAKRQMTWFRREPGVVWLDATAGPHALAAEVLELWRVAGGRSRGE
jgi:tRNA dimethylallyltransferase